MSLSDKLHTVKYMPDHSSHLKPDVEKCAQCKEKICTIICPAQVYGECGTGGLIVNYENCLECGACKIACENIRWEYPRGTKGVMFKHG